MDNCYDSFVDDCSKKKKKICIINSECFLITIHIVGVRGQHIYGMLPILKVLNYYIYYFTPYHRQECHPFVFYSVSTSILSTASDGHRVCHGDPCKDENHHLKHKMCSLFALAEWCCGKGPRFHINEFFRLL